MMSRRHGIFVAAALIAVAAWVLSSRFHRDGGGAPGRQPLPKDSKEAAASAAGPSVASRRAQISQHDQERVLQVMELMVTVVTMDSLSDFQDVSEADRARLQQLVGAGDFQGAIDFADTLADPQAKGQAAAAVIHAWAEKDPDAALACLAGSSFQPSAQQMVAASLFGAVASSYGASAKPLIRDALTQLPGSMPATLLEEAAKTWINTGDLSPTELAEWWQSACAARSTLDRSLLYDALATSGHGSADLMKYGVLAGKDVTRIVGDGLAAASGLASVPLPEKPSPSQADEALNINLYVGALGTISGSGQGVKAALSLADGLPASIQASYLEGVGKSQSQANPEDASAWLASAGTTQQAASFWKGYVEAASDPRPLPEAIDLFSRPGLTAELKAKAAAEIVARKYQQDADGTRETISQLPDGENRRIFQDALDALPVPSPIKP